LKVQYDEPLSKSAFNFNLRHYIEGYPLVDAAERDTLFNSLFGRMKISAHTIGLGPKEDSSGSGGGGGGWGARKIPKQLIGTDERGGATAGAYTRSLVSST